MAPDRLTDHSLPTCNQVATEEDKNLFRKLSIFTIWRWKHRLRQHANTHLLSEICAYVKNFLSNVYYILVLPYPFLYIYDVLPYVFILEESSARIYRPAFSWNKPKTLVFSYWKRAYWACFHENWVYYFGHWCTLLEKYFCILVIIYRSSLPNSYGGPQFRKAHAHSALQYRSLAFWSNG